MHPATASVLGILLALVACGPVSMDVAERQCFADARMAIGPHGKVGVGMGKKGLAGIIDVTISSDYLLGHDPAQIYADCIYRKTGQRPDVPLYDRPDWKG